jgi:hypothetical protein
MDGIAGMDAEAVDVGELFDSEGVCVLGEVGKTTVAEGVAIADDVGGSNDVDGAATDVVGGDDSVRVAVGPTSLFDMQRVDW